MKKIAYYLILLNTYLVDSSIMFANPIALPEYYFSELKFDSSGWKLELYYNLEYSYMPVTLNGMYLVSGKDTAYFKVKYILNKHYVVITEDYLTERLNLNFEGDTLELYSKNNELLDYLVYGFENNPLLFVDSSQSISRFNYKDYLGNVNVYHYYYDGKYYIDKSPTLGFENDTAGATGVIHGYVFDEDNKPTANQIVYLNSFSPLIHGSEVVAVKTNSAGYFTFNGIPSIKNFIFVRKGFEYIDSSVIVIPCEASYVEFKLNWSTEKKDEIDTTITTKGWITQQPPASIFELYDVFAVNNNLVFAIGMNCKIIRTTNGGENWSLVYSNSSIVSNNGSLFFVDSSHGWAVCDKYILKTEDCGKNWSIYDTKKMYDVNAVYFCDKDTGWVVGTYGTCLITTDGGKVWNEKSIPAHYNFFSDMHFINSRTGFITGTYGYWGTERYGVFLSTSDGGNTWKMRKTDDLYSISFINSDTGWISGRNGQNTILYKTINGGVMWDDIIINNHNFSSIDFINKYEGWALEEIGYDNLYFTYDGGKTWSNQYSYKNYRINSICFFDEKTGWAVGRSNDSYGVILKIGNDIIDNVDKSDAELVKDYKLSQNYPNPFNPSTVISYTIPTSPSVPLLGKESEVGEMFVELKVYDVLGREVSILVNKEQSPGNYKVEFDASGLPSGIYFYKLQVSNSAGIEGYTEVRKMMVLK